MKCDVVQMKLGTVKDSADGYQKEWDDVRGRGGKEEGKQEGRQIQSSQWPDSDHSRSSEREATAQETQ